MLGRVVSVLVGVAADEEVERDDEPHGLEEGQDGAGHRHPTLGPRHHLAGTGGSGQQRKHSLLV